MNILITEFPFFQSVRRHTVVTLTALALVTCSLRAVPTQLYVSPTGSDTIGTGSFSNPWATMEKARSHIQTSALNINMSDDIIVNMAAGDYILTAPVNFTAADSGSNSHNVIYRSSGATGSARILGGSRITNWVLFDSPNNIWRTNIGTASIIRTLHEDNRRAYLARSPNRAPEERYPSYGGSYRTSAAGGQNGTNHWIDYTSGDFDPSAWTITSAANMVWWAYATSPDWGMRVRTLVGANPTTRRLTFIPNSADPAGAPVPGANDRYFVEGIYQLIDAAGEFFHDPSSGYLYYKPYSANPNTAVTIVPTVATLINLTGAVGSANNVHNVIFSDLFFGDTAYTDVGFTNILPATIFVSSGSSIFVRRCEFARIGNYAVEFLNDGVGNTISDSWFHNIGIGAIAIINPLGRLTNPSDTSRLHTVTNCKIHDIGEIRTHELFTAGIALRNVSDSIFSHLEIYNSPRYAMTLRGYYSTQASPPGDLGLHYSRNNLFEYLNVYDCLSDSGDAGVIHEAAIASDADNFVNTWRQVVASGAYAHPSMLDHKPNGIFLDHPQSVFDQSFLNFRITWTANTAYRGNNNPLSSQSTSNVNFTGTFNDLLMQYSQIGLTSDFPVEFDNRNEFIADDRTAWYESVGASWVDTAIAGLYKGDAQFNNANSASQYADYRPSLPSDGMYEIYVWRPGPISTGTTVANYTVTHDGGVTAFTVNQASGVNGWVRLGTGTFALKAGRPAGTSFVRLSSATSDAKPVRADAIRFVRVSSVPSGSLLINGTTYPVASFAPVTQDNGSFGIFNANSEIELTGNSWKKVNFSYNITANTIVTFDFFCNSTSQGDIHGLQFANDDTTVDATKAVQVWGTETNWAAIQSSYTTPGAWQTKAVSLASLAGTSFTRLVFIGDDDLNGGDQISRFGDVVFSEASGIPADEVARWTLDNTAIDSATVGTANNLSLFGSPLYTTGSRVGTHALALDGVVQYASTSNQTDLNIGTGDFAISGWFYRTPNAATNLRVISKGAGTDTNKGYAIYGGDTGLNVALGNGTMRIYANKGFSGTNSWHHVAVNFDRDGNMTMYIDGVAGTPVPISAFNGLDLSSTDALNLGRNVNSGAQLWPGRLDQFRIFKRILTQSEITALAAEL
jgi:hypothetical protein